MSILALMEDKRESIAAVIDKSAHPHPVIDLGSILALCHQDKKELLRQKAELQRPNHQELPTLEGLIKILPVWPPHSIWPKGVRLSILGTRSTINWRKYGRTIYTARLKRLIKFLPTWTPDTIRAKGRAIVKRCVNQVQAAVLSDWWFLLLFALPDLVILPSVKGTPEATSGSSSGALSFLHDCSATRSIFQMMAWAPSTRL